MSLKSVEMIGMSMDWVVLIEVESLGVRIYINLRIIDELDLQ